MIQNQFNRIRIFFILGATIFLITDKLYSGNNIFLMTFIALLASGTIGLAHGSLDWSLAKRWGLRTNSWQNVYFVISYVLCILVTLIVWYYIPRLALSVFMLMSVVHFAGDWRQEMGSVDAFILGLALICLPTLNFYSEVKSIFELLLSGHDATLFTDLMYYLAIISSGMLGLILVRLIWLGQHAWLVIEVLFLVLIGVLLTPIVYFGIYFCFLHAPKHWITMRQRGLYTRLSQGIYSTLWPTLCCVFGGVIAIYYLASTISFTDALCKTVFIGLAALTVPHWILIEIYGNNYAAKNGTAKHL